MWLRVHTLGYAQTKSKLIRLDSVLRKLSAEILASLCHIGLQNFPKPEKGHGLRA